MRSRWALFLSGRGTTAQSVLDLVPEIDVAVVVSSRKQARGRWRSAHSGIPVLNFHKDHSWMELDQRLNQAKVTSILLVGFMRIVPEDFCLRWKGRMWNIHPSLLPMHRGQHAIEKSFEAGSPMGVTIHEVTAEMDEGPRCMQLQVVRAAHQEEMFRRIARAEQFVLRRFVLQGVQS